MPLQFIVDDISTLPEAVQSLYAKDGEKFKLQLDGYEDPAGLKSALQKERDSAKAANKQASQWASIGKTPDEIQALMTRQRELEEGSLLSKEKYEEALKKRMEYVQADNDKKVKALEDRALQKDQLAAKLGDRALADAIRQAALKSGALPEATDDIILRAKALFRLTEDGDVAAFNGDEVLLAKDGKTPLSAIEWAEALRDVAPHLWPRGQGTGSTSAYGANGGKTIKQEAFNSLRPAERAKRMAEGYRVTE
jgi:hypothetical protein